MLRLVSGLLPMDDRFFELLAARLHATVAGAHALGALPAGRDIAIGP
jgi:hypothetical protein